MTLEFDWYLWITSLFANLIVLVIFVLWLHCRYGGKCD